ncbi:MAG TPA: hypothetical protein VMR44_10995 [Thermoanaerobaculia bacterium]|nr:hypothetical protein [Thermoanaerobaculia bacterium]
MDESEGCVFVASLITAAVAVAVTFTGALHRLFRRGNAALGAVRLGVALAMAWIALVLWRWADPSVTGFYVLFYLVMGYAVVKLFGQLGAAAWGARVRVDAGERQNLAAGLFIAAWTLATGMIFGGSLWGEADPVGDDEGGWWIPATFFALGWTALVTAFSIYRRREGKDLKTRLRQERSVKDAWGAGWFVLVSAALLTDAVAGDFWGWHHGLLSFGAIGGMLVVHEAILSRRGAEEEAVPWTVPTPARSLETVAYALVAAGVWWFQRFLDRTLGGGG